MLVAIHPKRRLIFRIRHHQPDAANSIPAMHPSPQHPMATSTYPFVSELRSQGREEGRKVGLEEGREAGLAGGREAGLAGGRAQDIERLLDKRGIAMTPANRDRITSCRDGKTLEMRPKTCATLARTPSKASVTAVATTVFAATAARASISIALLRQTGNGGWAAIVGQNGEPSLQ
jgi:hypothetical protein